MLSCLASQTEKEGRLNGYEVYEKVRIRQLVQALKWSRPCISQTAKALVDLGLAVVDPVEKMEGNTSGSSSSNHLLKSKALTLGKFRPRRLTWKVKATKKCLLMTPCRLIYVTYRSCSTPRVLPDVTNNLHVLYLVRQCDVENSNSKELSQNELSKMPLQGGVRLRDERTTVQEARVLP